MVLQGEPGGHRENAPEISRAPFQAGKNRKIGVER